MAPATLIMIAALLAQFVPGHGRQPIRDHPLFVTIPARHPGTSPKNYFVGAGHSVGWAVTSGLLPLAAHVILASCSSSPGSSSSPWPRPRVTGEC
jgi:hypothetical protein